jgi:AcrR family transcriptional regulator
MQHMSDAAPRQRPGRPRHVPDTGTASPKEQILDAAAALFVEHGFTATSTRMIAERVGIRQASLYYHYAGKDDILVELLSSSVRPSLDRIRALLAHADGATALYAAVLVDVQTLAEAAHNIGTLYLLPEVQSNRYDTFRAERAELQALYARLGASAATPDVRRAVPPHLLGELLIQLVEVTIHIRRARDLDTRDAESVAEAGLRICGLQGPAIDTARAEADRLVLAAAR